VRVFRATATDADRGSPESVEPGVRLSGRTLYLRVTVREGARCTFSYSTDGRAFHPLGPDFAARQGRWIGAKVGLFAAQRGGWPGQDGARDSTADFDWLRMESVAGR
jgi:hypothetical protein